MSEMSESIQRILLKFFSGDLIPIEVSKNITYKQLYKEVYHSLPKELCPKSIWQLTISHLLENGEYEEFKETDQLVFEKDENKYIMLFCILNEHNNYTVSLGRDYDAYDEYDSLNEDPKDYLFELRSISIHSWNNKDHFESYLFHPSTSLYYLIDGVTGKIDGRFEDEFFFKLPEDSKPFIYFSDLLEYLVNRLEFNSRTKEYLKIEFMKKFTIKYKDDNEY